MKMALDLAKKGVGRVNPNPLVGAVIVKEGRVIGEGYHEKYGGPHAEINACISARENVRGATLYVKYVTLEPCSHYGNTAPCVDKLIESEFARVVIGMVDPNPLVSGNGIRKLREAGIKVVVGILENECKRLNEVFIKYITTKKPFVVLKTAMTLDGKTATASGASKWITSNASRAHVHLLRNELTAIMVGVDTVIIDDPELTCRTLGGRNPIRIIVDSTLRIPYDSKVVTTAKEVETLIVTTEKAKDDKIRSLENFGITVVKTDALNTKVDLEDVITQLGKQGIDSILLEGGATLNYAAFESGIVDKVLIYIAPKVLGGEQSKTAVGGNGIQNLEDAFKIKNLSVSMIEEDILIEGYVKRSDV